jgi:DNA primase
MLYIALMDQVSQIKQKLDVVDVISSYISLKKAGRNYRGVCPFHSEKTPSFMVSPELQIFKCFGCGAAGDIFNFVEQIEGVDFPTALEQLAERAGIKLEKHDYDPEAALKKQIYFINELSAKFYHYILLNHPAGKIGLDYLVKQRKLTKETIKEFEIGCAPDNWDSLYKFLLKKGIKTEDMLQAGVIVNKQSGGGFIDKFRGRVMFPLKAVDGKILGFTARTLFNREPKYLNTAETSVFHKTFFLFGLDKNKLEIKRDGAIFVEGQMDLITAWQEGIKNIVSVSGTSLTNSQLTLLSRYTNDITFCFDSDSAGINASYRAVEMAEKLNFNIKMAVIPTPYKDLDDMVRANIEEAKRYIKNSIPAYDFFILTLLKKYDKNTALGKKSIMDELIPLFSKISNQVLFDHYSKKIASELNVSPETVLSVMKKGKTEDFDEATLYPESKLTSYKQNPEGYFLAIILKTEAELSEGFVNKLKASDFHNENLRNVFEKLKTYLEGKKKAVNINTLLKKFDENMQKVLSELYLWDLEGMIDFENKEKAEKELDFAVRRIKLESTKKALKDLSDEIKMAEDEKDEEKLDKLAKKFDRLSKGLL